jgi:hypothetical protein
LHDGRLQAQNGRYSAVLRLFSESKLQITVRDVYRHNITPRSQIEAAELLLNEMESAGILTHEDRPTERKNHVQRLYRKASK